MAKKPNGFANQSINVAVNPANPVISAGTPRLPKRRTRSEIKQGLLKKDPTAEYQSSRYAYFGELFVSNLPLWRLWTARMMLTSDPIVDFSMNIRNAALMAAEVTVTSPNEQVRQWVQDQWDYLWKHHRPKLVSAKKWGFAPLQTIYKVDEKGLLTINGLKDFAPEDSRALEVRSGNQLCGMRVKGKPLYHPQALWLKFNPEFGSQYGVALTRRQYPAWYEKWMDHGAKRLQQLRMVKDAYIGDIFWYPPHLKLTLPDGNEVSWRDLLRETAENRLSGAALTLPRLLDNNGKELTGYSPPQTVAGATEIFQWVDLCDDNILKGADIPREVVQAADTGSGFSGRSIPFLVLLSVCTNELIQIVQCVDEQVLRPVAWLNWGKDVDYKIEPKSLVESFAGDISGSSLAGSSIGGPVGEQGPPQQAPPQQVPPSQHSERGTDLIPGGKGDKEHDLSKFNPVQLAAGIKVELEHTSDHRVALEIAIDHLTEDPNYYSKLAKVEPDAKEAVKEASQHKEGKEQKKAHDYSSTQFNLPGDLAFEVRMVGDLIDPNDLAEKGKELNPHVTALYGLHTDKVEDLEDIVHNYAPIAIQLGPVTMFTKEGEYDVLKIDVLSKGLHELHEQLTKFPHTSTFPDYKPHITIAYVKPGRGEYYAKRLNMLEGRVAVFDRLVFSNKLRNHTPIRLSGQAQVDEAAPTKGGEAYAIPFMGSVQQNEQFIELPDLLSKLRGLIGKGLLAAQQRVKGLAESVRRLPNLAEATLDSLSQLIAGQIAQLQPLLGLDLTTDTLASHATGHADVAGRLPSSLLPLLPKAPSEAADAFTGVLAGLTSPPNLPVPAVAQPSAAVHLPALQVAVEVLDRSPVQVGTHYLETAQHVRNGSFAITGDLTEKAVADVRTQLSKALAEGLPQKEFIAVVTKRLEEEGSPLSPAHLENVFRTNTLAAYSNAQDAALKDPMVSDAFPYAGYGATADKRVRPEHWDLESYGLNGTNIYRADDPTFKLFRPPWSYNCILPETVVEGVFWAGFKSRYKGQAVKITTESGNDLSLTVNHPVATQRGWVAAGELTDTDYVIEYCFEVKPELSGHSKLASNRTSGSDYTAFFSPSFDKQNTPALCDQVFRSLQMLSGCARLLVPVDNFHGDAERFDGYVQIVAADRKLLNHLVQEDWSENGYDLSFPSMDFGLPFERSSGSEQLAGCGTLTAPNSSPSCFALPSGFDSTLAGSQSCPFSGLRFGPRSWANAVLNQTSMNITTANPEGCSQSLYRRAVKVKTNNLFDFSRIKKLTRFHYNGPVYDFTDTSGWIIANGIGISNCRCHWYPVTVEQAAKKGVVEAISWLQRAKDIVKIKGGTFYQYLNETAPVQAEYVEPPPFKPDPAFKRDLV